MGFLDNFNPLTAVADGLNSVVSTIGKTGQSAWNDFTGKTATEMSTSASKANTAAQLAWERERANNAHQWEVADLEKAGINPILSAGGSGAATGGISPQMPDTSAYKGWSAILPIISEIANTKATLATANKVNQEAGLLSEQTTTEKIIQSVQSAIANKTSEEALGQQIMNLINQEKRKQAEIDTEWYQPEKILNFSTKAAGPIIEILKSFGFFKLAKNLGKGKFNTPGYNKGYGNNPGGYYQQNNYYYPGKWN